MTVGATEQKVFHSLTQNCILKMEKSQQISTENPLPSSCHPAHFSNNIPYSLAYRIVRICSKPELRDAQFLKLRDFLLSRNYNTSIVDSAIVGAKAIPR